MRTKLMTAIAMAGSLALFPTQGFAGEVVSQNDVKPVAGPAANFTGKVHVRMLTKATKPGQAGTAMVTFEPNARSNWHTHPAGQTLFVTQGCGWTQEESQPVKRICAGDAVYVEPGVKHWHGATSTETMSHLAITESLEGSNVNWMEPVTDAQFSGPGE